MGGQLVEFASNGSNAQGYLARPDSGSCPGVIVIQEWWGLVDHIKALADALRGRASLLWLRICTGASPRPVPTRPVD